MKIFSNPLMSISSSITAAIARPHFGSRFAEPEGLGLSGRSRRRFSFNIVKHKTVIYAVILFAVAFAIGRFSTGNIATAPYDPRAAAPAVLAEEKLNKTYAFPIVDAKGKEVTKFQYVIQNAQIMNQIFVKGQRATAVKGKTFLVLNLKVSNSYTQGVQLASIDYVRLTKNNSNEKIAPDIHNDPVEVQAISTKYTRIGFSINDSDKNLALYVGKLDGEKEKITLRVK